MRSYTSVIAVNGAVLLFMVGVGMIVAVLPHRILSLSGSISEVGYLASAFAIPYMLFQLPIGNLADRFGFKVFLLGGYCLCACAGALYYVADTPLLLLVGRMLQGIGEAPLWALAPALLSLQFPTRKGQVIGFYNAAIHIGLTGGSLLGVFLLPVWRGNEVFLFFVGISVLGGLILLCFVENPRHIALGETLRIDYTSLLLLIRKRDVMSVLCGIALYGAGYGVFLTIIPAFLLEVKHVNQTGIGLVFTIFYIAMSLSQIVTGPLADRTGWKRPMMVGMVMAVSGIGGFAYIQQPWLNVFLGIASCGLGMFAVASMAYLNERVSPSLKGTISGMFYVFWGIGFFLGPLVVGEYGQRNQYIAGFLELAGLFSLEALALIWLDKRLHE